MRRHPPVMVTAVVQSALQGELWRRTQRKADAMVCDLLRQGLHSTDLTTRTMLLGSESVHTAPLVHNVAALSTSPDEKKSDTATEPQLARPAGSESGSGAPATHRHVQFDEANALADLMATDEPLASSALPPTGDVLDNATALTVARSNQLEATAPPLTALQLTVEERFENAMIAHAERGSALMHLAGGQTPRFVTYDVLDCTLGGGHHSAAILAEGAPYSRVVALDCDHDVRRTAAAMRDEFGVERFQFFPERMSRAHDLFGDEAFDCVMLDPGPNMDQLDDLSRGFTLEPGVAGAMTWICVTGRSGKRRPGSGCSERKGPKSSASCAFTVTSRLELRPSS
jgi:hypothetical protein